MDRPDNYLSAQATHESLKEAAVRFAATLPEGKDAVMYYLAPGGEKHRIFGVGVVDQTLLLLEGENGSFFCIHPFSLQMQFTAEDMPVGTQRQVIFSSSQLAGNAGAH